MRAVPTPVLVCATVVTCTTIIGIVVLTILGADVATFRMYVNVVANLVGVVFGLGGYLSATQAAHSVSDLSERLKDSPAGE